MSFLSISSLREYSRLLYQVYAQPRSTTLRTLDSGHERPVISIHREDLLQSQKLLNRLVLVLYLQVDMISSFPHITVSQAARIISTLEEVRLVAKSWLSSVSSSESPSSQQAFLILFLLLGSVSVMVASHQTS